MMEHRVCFYWHLLSNQPALPKQLGNNIAFQSKADHRRTGYTDTLYHYTVCLQVGNLKAAHPAGRLRISTRLAAAFRITAGR